MSINLFLAKNKDKIYRNIPVVAISLIIIELLHLKVSDKPIQDFSPLVLYLSCSLLFVFASFFLLLLLETLVTVYGYFIKSRNKIENVSDDINNENLVIVQKEDLEGQGQSNDKVILGNYTDEEKLNTVLNYADDMFKDYLSAEDLDKLKNALSAYHKQVIKLEELPTLEILEKVENKMYQYNLENFGYSIWNHYGRNHFKQDVMAACLKFLFKGMYNESTNVADIVKHLARNSSNGPILQNKNLYEKYLPGKYKK